MTVRERHPRLLLVDIGNTRLKWAPARGRCIGAPVALERAAWSRAGAGRRRLAVLGPVSRILVVSVADERFNAAFARDARAVLGVAPEFFTSARRAAGVVNAYAEPWRLGADRWLAAIAGHHFHAPPRDVCVVDIGTATTVDLVDARGRHRGGAIVPGPDLMVRSLLSGTSGIRRRAAGAGKGARAGAGASRRQAAFARSTRDALESGARRASAAAIDRFAADARVLLGRAPLLLLTGGAVGAVAPLVRTRHRRVPDLVLRGLLVLARGLR